jgi:hypothetical protein
MEEGNRRKKIIEERRERKIYNVCVIDIEVHEKEKENESGWERERERERRLSEKE